MKILSALIVFIFLFIHDATAQPGCTDPQATNYDALATINDGSCIYAQTNLNLIFLTYLDTTLDETSGITVINDNVWTHVDNTDSSIYMVDSLSNYIIHHPQINYPNKDWEDITEGLNDLFIGDFGNNSGSRTDLCILKIPKANLLDTLPLIPGKIFFNYPDQIDFTPNQNNNQFDCEAFFYLNDTLHLFTKDWVTKWTKHYTLTTDTGFQSAILVDSFFVDGLITSAAIQNGVIVLLGYDNTGFAPCFLWMLFDYNSNSFFSGNKRKFSLGSAISVGQTEGICFRADKKGYISNEHFQQLTFNVKAQLKRFDLSPYLPGLINSNLEFADAIPLKIWPTLIQSELNVLVGNNYLNSTLTLTDTSGKNVSNYAINRTANCFDVSEIASGNYLISLIKNNNVISTFKLIKN